MADRYTAFGNHTDSISAAAGQAMSSACKHASIHCISSHLQDHENMRKLVANLTRRSFLRSATLLGTVSMLFRGKAVLGVRPTTEKPPLRKNSFRNPATLSNGSESSRITWTSATCDDGKMPCINADGHPTFENPYVWTIEQMDDIYCTFLHPRSMAYNIKWMGLASIMREGPYEKVRTRLENQTHI
ncbi:MAG: hypothetical protein CBD74_06710 [Saprospirales bacterium TMED214]|nr:MAG: hypothetical protein CBD74_06710 [Saprospirales bacterium TMED214]